MPLKPLHCGPHSVEASLRISQVYALEGGCYVLVASTTVGETGRELFCGGDAAAGELLAGCTGFSRIFAPDGQPIGTVVPPGEEGFASAEIDLALIALAKAMLDPVGHYHRGDVTQLLFDASRRRPVVPMRDTAQPAGAATPAVLPSEDAPADDDPPGSTFDPRPGR